MITLSYEYSSDNVTRTILAINFQWQTINFDPVESQKLLLRSIVAQPSNDYVISFTNHPKLHDAPLNQFGGRSGEVLLQL